MNTVILYQKSWLSWKGFVHCSGDTECLPPLEITQQDVFIMRAAIQHQLSYMPGEEQEYKRKRGEKAASEMILPTITANAIYCNFLFGSLLSTPVHDPVYSPHKHCEIHFINFISYMRRLMFREFKELALHCSESMQYMIN